MHGVGRVRTRRGWWMIRIGRSAGLAVVCVLAAGFTAPAAHAETGITLDPGVAPMPELDEIYRRFAMAYRDLDARAVAGLYTRDALYLQPGRDIKQGRVPIEASFRRFFDHSRSVGLVLEISFRIVARQVSDRLAYDVGIFTLVTTREGEEMGRSFGKFVNVSRPDDDGAWRFQVGSHSDLDAASAR